MTYISPEIPDNRKLYAYAIPSSSMLQFHNYTASQKKLDRYD